MSKSNLLSLHLNSFFALSLFVVVVEVVCFGELETRWAKNVTAENVWKEYPRPGLERSEESWMSLNGVWEFDASAKSLDNPPFDVSTPLRDKILVPFPVESSLSRIKRINFKVSLKFLVSVSENNF